MHKKGNTITKQNKQNITNNTNNTKVIQHTHQQNKTNNTRQEATQTRTTKQNQQNKCVCCFCPPHAWVCFARFERHVFLFFVCAGMCLSIVCKGHEQKAEKSRNGNMIMNNKQAEQKLKQHRNKQTSLQTQMHKKSNNHKTEQHIT